MEPVSFTGAINEVRLKRNRDVGVAGLRGREGWEKVVVGYVTRGERRGVGGGEGEITPFRDGSGFPGVEANGGCFFVAFGNRGQAGGAFRGAAYSRSRSRSSQGRQGFHGPGAWNRRLRRLAASRKLS